MQFIYFTKTLKELDVKGLAAFCKEVGVDGVDILDVDRKEETRTGLSGVNGGGFQEFSGSGSSQQVYKGVFKLEDGAIGVLEHYRNGEDGLVELSRGVEVIDEKCDGGDATWPGF